jgi:hypothetical protein
MDSERCVECGQLFPQSELLSFPGFPVCSGCKRLAVSKIASGDPVGNVWRHGSLLVIARNGVLPRRCVVCNQPAPECTEKQATLWRRPFGVSVFRTFIPLCSVHRRKRIIRVFIWGACAIGTTGILILTRSPSSYATILFIALFPMLVLIILMASVVLLTVRSTETHAFLKGAGEPFLAELPTWPKN